MILTKRYFSKAIASFLKVFFIFDLQSYFCYLLLVGMARVDPPFLFIEIRKVIFKQLVRRIYSLRVAKLGVRTLHSFGRPSSCLAEICDDGVIYRAEYTNSK